MDLLIVPVPLFSKDVAVDSYMFRYQKGNDLITSSRNTSLFDGAMRSPILETLNAVGLEAFTMGKSIFVPINHLMLLVNLDQQCTEDPSKIVFLMDSDTKVDDDHIAGVKRLKSLGYRFAIQKIDSTQKYDEVLKLCDFVLLNQKKADEPAHIQFRKEIKQNYKHISIVVTHIDNVEIFSMLQGNDNRLYEGRFYRTPITKGINKVSPLKTNLINLINLVQNENFEFSSVAAVVQRDTALTISLLRMVNSPYMGMSQKVKTINHAVTMLGQIEVRKWVTTAVSKLMGADKPDEITKLSLMRARFAENLAAKFDMKIHAQELFLMGLFSVMDVVLEIPMEEALKLVRVSDSIHSSLVERKGDFYPIYQFILYYENADWASVSRMMILYDLTAEDVYDCYISASKWYNDLIMNKNTYN